MRKRADKQVSRHHARDFFNAIQDALTRAVGEPTGRTLAPRKPKARDRRSADTAIALNMAAERKRKRRIARNIRNHERQQAGYYYAGVAEARREARNASAAD